MPLYCERNTIILAPAGCLSPQFVQGQPSTFVFDQPHRYLYAYPSTFLRSMALITSFTWIFIPLLPLFQRRGESHPPRLALGGLCRLGRGTPRNMRRQHSTGSRHSSDNPRHEYRDQDRQTDNLLYSCCLLRFDNNFIERIGQLEANDAPSTARWLPPILLPRNHQLCARPVRRQANILEQVVFVDFYLVLGHLAQTPKNVTVNFRGKCHRQVVRTH